MAIWIPVTVVPRSFATVAMDTFMTELSKAMRNWANARVNSTDPPVDPRPLPTCGSAIGVRRHAPGDAAQRGTWSPRSNEYASPWMRQRPFPPVAGAAHTLVGHPFETV